MSELARRLGYGELFPQSEDELVRLALDGSGYTLEDIKDAGGWVKIDTPMMEFKKWEKGRLRQDGKPGFETPTGKFEIHSTVLEEYGYESLPKYTEPKEGPLADKQLSKEFPLVFNSGARLHTDFRSQHHGIPGLVRDNPEPFVEINTTDAERRGIKNGDLVEVRTRRGAVRFRARVTGDIVAGAVECNMGGGGPVGPREWRERNVNDLTDVTNYDEISGFPVYKALLCDVVRVSAATDAGGKIKAPSVTNANARSREGEFAHVIPKKSAIANRIYLDNNATTELAAGVREAMTPYLERFHGNPSSIHGAGRAAKEAVERARRQVAGLIGAKPRRIVFSGGGSEADNLAIKGAAIAYRERGNHVITTRIEHPAVLGACEFLEKAGFEVTYLDVDRDGMVDSNTLRSVITRETILVSVMMANNEVGTVLPIREMCAIAHESGAIFHTDAVQAVGKLEIDVEALEVDMLTLSAHKFPGPNGVGALYVKKGVALEPLVHGGKQENGFRAGTENVAAIVGLGEAAKMAAAGLNDTAAEARLRDRLEEGIIGLVPGATLNGHRGKRLPNSLNLTLPGLRGESLVVALDQHGVSISSGSACKSGSPEPTHVLMAMGRSEVEAHCSVRLSLSRYTTGDDVEITIETIANVLEEMETTVRFLPCK
jgi:cysteine desulfurase NifS